MDARPSDEKGQSIQEESNGYRREDRCEELRRPFCALTFGDHDGSNEDDDGDMADGQHLSKEIPNSTGA